MPEHAWAARAQSTHTPFASLASPLSLRAMALLVGDLELDLFVAAQHRRRHGLPWLAGVEDEHQIFDAGNLMSAQPDQHVAPGHSASIRSATRTNTGEQNTLLAG